MATGTSVKHRRQPSCSGSFAWLGSHPSLATRKDATVEVVLPRCRCHNCFSKSCLSSVPFGPTSLHQKRLYKNNNFGTATRVEMTRWLRNTCRCVSSSAMNRLGQRRILATCHKCYSKLFGVCCIWPIWAHISTAKGSRVRITTLGQPPLAGSKMVLRCPELSRDHVVQKR